MREIRFRVWEDGKMYYQVLAGGFYYTVPTIYLEKDGVFEWVNSTGENPVMQYTGLKDKNGKDIYEGDILSPSNRVVEYHTDVRLKSQYEVYGGAGFYTRATKGLTRPEELGIFSFGFTQAEVSEVIGNIYENVELINNQKEK